MPREYSSPAFPRMYSMRNRPPSHTHRPTCTTSNTRWFHFPPPPFPTEYLSTLGRIGNFPANYRSLSSLEIKGEKKSFQARNIARIEYNKHLVSEREEGGKGRGGGNKHFPWKIAKKWRFAISMYVFDGWCDASCHQVVHQTTIRHVPSHVTNKLIAPVLRSVSSNKRFQFFLGKKNPPWT